MGEQTKNRPNTHQIKSIFMFISNLSISFKNYTGGMVAPSVPTVDPL